MATGSEILSYRGNVAAGLGAGGATGAYGDTDAQELNDTMRQTAYLNMQKNRAIWEQKIKDRDDVMRAIAAGTVQINGALPEDRKKLEALTEKVKQIYLKNNGNVKADPKQWLELNSQLAKFREANIYAKSRLDSYNKGMADAADEKNPVRQKQMRDWYNGQIKKDLYEPVIPYQQQFDYDPAIALPELPVETTTTLSRDGQYSISKKTTDLDKGWAQYAFDYAQNDKNHTAINTDAMLGSFFGWDGTKSPRAVQEAINLANRRLYTIAKLKGYDPDKPDTLPAYLREIKPQVNPATGRLEPVDTKPLAAYKLNIALKYDPTADAETKTPSKAYWDAKKAQSQIGVNNARAAKYRADAAKASASPDGGLENIFSDITARTKTIQYNGHPQQVVMSADLPEGWSKALQGVNDKGNPLPLEPFDLPGGAKGYIVDKSDYYISPSGKRYSPAALHQAFDKVKGRKIKFSDGKTRVFKDYNDFLNYQSSVAGFKQEEVLRGNNGVATAQSAIQGLRAINNAKNSGKYDFTLYESADNNPK